MLENHALIFIVTTIPFPRKPSFIVKRWGWSDISCFGPVTQRPPPSTSKKAFSCLPETANYPRFTMFCFSKNGFTPLVLLHQSLKLLGKLFPVSEGNLSLLIVTWLSVLIAFAHYFIEHDIRCFVGDALYIY